MSPVNQRTQAEPLDVVIEALRRFHVLRINGNLPPLGERLEFESPGHSVDRVYGWQEPDFTLELVNEASDSGHPPRSSPVLELLDLPAQFLDRSLQGGDPLRDER